MKLIFVLLSLLLGTALAQPNDPPSTHGMLIFGKSKIYLSHLPMFHNPHDYQVLLEVEIDPKIKKLFLESKKNDPKETVYTIVPERFVLPKKVAEKGIFNFVLFKGHFERGGQAMTDWTQAKIKTVIYNRKFHPRALRPDQARYIIFGDSGDRYMAHYISVSPDFDSIVEVSSKSELLGKLLKLTPHLELDFEDEATDKPLGGNQEYIGVGDQPAEFKLKTGRVLYTEFGDLRH